MKLTRDRTQAADRSRRDRVHRPRHGRPEEGVTSRNVQRHSVKSVPRLCVSPSVICREGCGPRRCRGAGDDRCTNFCGQSLADTHRKGSSDSATTNRLQSTLLRDLTDLSATSSSRLVSSPGRESGDRLSHLIQPLLSARPGRITMPSYVAWTAAILYQLYRHALPSALTALFHWIGTSSPTFAPWSMSPLLISRGARSLSLSGSNKHTGRHGLTASLLYIMGAPSLQSSPSCACRSTTRRVQSSLSGSRSRLSSCSSKRRPIESAPGSTGE